MNKKTLIKAACLLLASTMAAGCFTACVTDNSPDVTVTVEGGTGGGTYKEGESCTVTAQVPEGSQFLGWTVYDVTVSTANPYTFEVDFDIDLKAVFSTPEKAQYTVTVNGGMIGENGPSSIVADEGAQLTIYPDESQARKFTNWLVGGEKVTDNPYTFTVTGNTEITAEFEEYCMISVSGGTVEGQRSQIVPKGSEVTVKANTDDVGRQFVYWYTLDETFSEVPVAYTEEYSFTLDNSTKIYAKFLNEFTVTTVNGTMSGSTESTFGVLDGETATIVPDAAPEADKAFIGWYIDGERVSTDREYSFEVTHNMTLEAKYGQLNTVQLEKPDSSKNANFPETGIIYREGGGSIAFDRITSDKTETMFVEGVEYVRYDIYTSREADKSAPIGSFRVRVIPGADAAGGTAFTGYVETIDGSVSRQIIRGAAGDYYVDVINANEFYSLLASALGYRYCAGQAYYFAATAVGAEYPVIDTETDTATQYISSERSEITSASITPTPGAPVGEYEINVVGGTIDGTLTSIVAGHGASVTVSTQMPEDEETDWVFLGWKEVTYGAEGEEVLGTTLSRDLTYTFSATRDITLKAVFADREDVTAIQLPTPDNSENQLIYDEGGPNNAIALDRAPGGSMFNANVDYVIFYMYTSPDAAKEDYVGRIKMKVDINKDGEGGVAIVGYFSMLDDSDRKDIIRGVPNNYYHMDKSAFSALIKVALGANYDASQEYYFACQAVALGAEYLNSEISAIGTNGIRF